MKYLVLAIGLMFSQVVLADVSDAPIVLDAPAFEMIELTEIKEAEAVENLVAPLWFCCPGNDGGYTPTPEGTHPSPEVYDSDGPPPEPLVTRRVGEVRQYSGYFWANRNPPAG